MEANITNTTGRRKTAVARIYLSEGTGSMVINGRDFKEYFPTLTHQYKLNQPFAITETAGKYDVKVNVKAVVLQVR